MSLISKYKGQLYRFLVSLSNPQISSKRLALGFGVGTFIAILPTPGFGILLGIFVVFLFKKINKISMIFSFAVWNPLLLAPIYLLSYKIGALLFNPSSVSLPGNTGWFSEVLIYIKTYLFGNALLALVFSIISYFTVLKIANLYKQKRAVRKFKINIPK